MQITRLAWGGGNFANFYPRYKAAGALETVADPHNFVLSLLAQYGVVGVVGFLAAVFAGLVRMVFVKGEDKTKGIIGPILFVAIVVFLLHNCIDFAIFEPGIMTVFWAVVGCLVAMDFNLKDRDVKSMRFGIAGKVLVSVVGVALVWGYIGYAFWPVVGTTVKINQAYEAAEYGQLETAGDLLAEAAEADKLSGAALSLNGGMYLQRFYLGGSTDSDLLLAAEECLLGAIERNEAEYKNYERLAEVYGLLARGAEDGWLEKALGSAENAVERYPNSGRLRVQLAKIAELSGDRQKACVNYEKAIEIEDEYRGQFAVMYPGADLFSRLGEDVYGEAKKKIKELCR